MFKRWLCLSYLAFAQSDVTFTAVPKLRLLITHVSGFSIGEIRAGGVLYSVAVAIVIISAVPPINWEVT